MWQRKNGGFSSLSFSDILSLWHESYLVTSFFSQNFGKAVNPRKLKLVYLLDWPRSFELKMPLTHTVALFEGAEKRAVFQYDIGRRNWCFWNLAPFLFVFVGVENSGSMVCWWFRVVLFLFQAEPEFVIAVQPDTPTSGLNHMKVSRCGEQQH